MGDASNGDPVARQHGVGHLVADLEDLGDEPEDGDVPVRAWRQRERRPVVDEVVGDEVTDALDVAVVDGIEHRQSGLFDSHGCTFPIELN